jgi:hypothetical protein
MLRAGAILLGVLAASLGTAGAAAADPTFEAFRELCVNTRAQAPAALAAADAKGWTDMPAMFQDEIDRAGFSAGEGRATSRNRVIMLMYAGQGAPVVEGAPLPVRACAVAARPANNQSVRTAAAVFAAVPTDPALPAQKGEAYAFTTERGVHQQVTAAELRSPRGQDLIRRGRVSMLIVAGRPAAPLLVYAIPTL